LIAGTRARSCADRIGSFTAGQPVTVPRRQGVPIEVVARLLTHRSPATTSRTYVHLDAADIREALHRAGAWREERK